MKLSRNNYNKKNIGGLIIVGVLLLVVGVSFAFYTAGVDFLGEGSNLSYRVNDMLKVTYDAGNKLDASLTPGHSVSKGFKVTVTPTSKEKKAIYAIKLNITENTYVYCDDTTYDETTNPCKRGEEELIYRLKDETGNILSEDTLMDKTGDIELVIETKEVSSKTDYNYTLEIEFKETEAFQNHNQNKAINGSIEVEYSDGYNGDLNILAVNIETETGSGKFKSNDNIPIGPYELNEEKSYCEANNTRLENIEFFYNKNEGTFGINRVNSKGAKCYLYFDKLTPAMSTILAGIAPKETAPNYDYPAYYDEGVYKIKDGMYGGYSYVWRGAVSNNWVKFADMYWRIIRINGDGSIRLIYTGDSSLTNVTIGGSGRTATGTGTQIQTSSYNSSQDHSEYVGYTYLEGSQRTTEGIASTIKGIVDTWYDNNIRNNTTYSSYVADGKYCNSRDTASGSIWASQPSNSFNYAAYERVRESQGPTLSCLNGDIYTLNAGLITADEVEMAGGKFGQTNSNYYLFTKQNYWTMSPSSWYYYDNSTMYSAIFYVNQDGYINTYAVRNGYGVRPVVNLKADTIFNGNGTKDNPYVVE